MSDDTAPGAASRVVLSYDPAAVDDVSRYWVEDELSRDAHAGSIRRRYDAVAEGDDLEEFVSRGCGVPMDVTLRVDRLEGGGRIGADTAVEIRPRD